MNEINGDLPALAGDEARNIDKDVTERLGRIRVLESVATRIADTIHYHLTPGGTSTNCPREETPLLFVAGKGNNGANAMAAARILSLRGWNQIRVVLLLDWKDASATLRPNIQEQIELFEAFVGKQNLLAMDFEAISQFSQGILIDGVLGTGIAEPPRGVSATAIQAMNEAIAKNTYGKVQILSIDMPSGLNHITGEAPGDCVRATWTINLHMLKQGQLAESAKPFVGELWSAETSLGFHTFPGLEAKFQAFYKDGPIRKVFS